MIDDSIDRIMDESYNFFLYVFLSSSLRLFTFNTGKDEQKRWKFDGG